ncbi:hypothetical protein IF2G_08401 [Cordyceps javanica]|nr:hypothetical protein IF2G_08401 [Cordyceps javanica]
MTIPTGSSAIRPPSLLESAFIPSPRYAGLPSILGRCRASLLHSIAMKCTQILARSTCKAIYIVTPLPTNLIFEGFHRGFEVGHARTSRCSVSVMVGQLVSSCTT